MHEYFNNAVSPDEIEFVRQFVRTGFDGERAARFTWGLSAARARAKSERLLADPRITGLIAEAQQSAIGGMKLDVRPVLLAARQLEQDSTVIESVKGALVNGIDTRAGIIGYASSCYSVSQRGVRLALDRYESLIWQTHTGPSNTLIYSLI